MATEIAFGAGLLWFVLIGIITSPRLALALAIPFYFILIPVTANLAPMLVIDLQAGLFGTICGAGITLLYMTGQRMGNGLRKDDQESSLHAE